MLPPDNATLVIDIRLTANATLLAATYNGVSMVGSDMPRDTRTQVSVLTSAYDPNCSE